jgi:DNA polymerase
MMTVYDFHVLKSYIEDCNSCELHEGRIKPVVDKGNVNAKLFICGMVPAKEENEQGLPFVGRAGRLLDEILEEAGLTLKDVYITNLVKCFLAAGNSLKEEWVDKCFPYLLAQIAVLQPKVIITLGADAANALIGKPFGTITKDRGRIISFNDDTKVMPTYHPSYLLRKGGRKSPDFDKVVQDFTNAIKNLKY